MLLCRSPHSCAATFPTLRASLRYKEKNGRWMYTANCTCSKLLSTACHSFHSAHDCATTFGPFLRATHCVKVTFETMKTMERYGAARIPLIVSLCTTVAGPGGGEAYVPIVARVVWVPAPIPGGPPRQVTAVLPVSLPYCMMPPDMVVMVLHRGEEYRS